MSKNDGGPAFPIPLQQGEAWKEMGLADGMTLRDWFAGQALVGWYAAMAHPRCGGPSYDAVDPGIARMVYDQADAMLAEREK